MYVKWCARIPIMTTHQYRTVQQLQRKESTVPQVHKFTEMLGTDHSMEEPENVPQISILDTNDTLKEIVHNLDLNGGLVVTTEMLNQIED